MKISIHRQILAFLITVILMMVSASAVVLADQMPALHSNPDSFTANADAPAIHTDAKVVNSNAADDSIKTPAIVIIPTQDSAQVTDIRRTFVLGFFILILLTVSLVFVFSFSY